MQELNLPRYGIRVTERDGKRMILDILRRKFVALTPEEWVRQHFVHFLAEHKGYPTAYLANEVNLCLGDKKMRCDTVLYDSTLRPKMIIEYKAPSVKITQQVFDQITVYNFLLKVDYLIVSNGLQHYCCRINHDTRQYEFVQGIPDYKDL